jgi:GNAT superfamily N-acetyltransferase
VEVRPLSPGTWPAYAALIERHNGVWGGCWCMGFHPEGVGGRHHTAEGNRAAKEARVVSGDAHAAVVFDGDEAVGWCQFGSPEELPRIKHRRAYEEGLVALPDWRITCFFVASDHRRQGVASAALGGAVDLIAGLGGGTVESYPEDAEGRKASSSFLHNGTVALFEAHGFQRVRRIGKHRWVVSRTAG